MENIDWYMAIVIVAVLSMGCFFGYLEHVEKLAGCVK